jgi:TetR/AcrR family transcriptional repressor of nem operon
VKEVQVFADVNVAWLTKQLAAAGIGSPGSFEVRARAIYAAVAGAQMISRSRSDITASDAWIEGYRAAGPLLG